MAAPPQKFTKLSSLPFFEGCPISSFVVVVEFTGICDPFFSAFFAGAVSVELLPLFPPRISPFPRKELAASVGPFFFPPDPCEGFHFVSCLPWPFVSP